MRKAFLFNLICAIGFSALARDNAVKRVFEGVFENYIDGVAYDLRGLVIVTNVKGGGANSTIGILRVGSSESHVHAIPDGGKAAGMRLLPNHRLLIADYKNHRVLQADLRDPNHVTFETLVDDSKMTQPNDLVATSGGDLYLTDPLWKDASGRILVARAANGYKVEVLKSLDGVTNGIELSADEKTLFVTISNVKKSSSFKDRAFILAYPIDSGGLGEPKVISLQNPDAHSIDGLRADRRGRLYVTRTEKGRVDIIDPSSGNTTAQINLLGRHPTNLTFGGEDGKTVYVSLMGDLKLNLKSSVESFQVED